MPSPSTKISKLLAHQRALVFTALKKPFLESQIGSTEVKSIKYDFDAFRNLLNKFDKLSGQPYDGVRVYFASYKKDITNDPQGTRYIPAGQNKKMTLIFVATTAGVDLPNGTHVHNDDLDNCYIIDRDDKIQNLKPEVTASNWIREYQIKKMPSFEKNGKDETGNPDFEETKSIWYAKEFFLRNPGSPPQGFLDYLDAIASAGNIVDDIEILLAGYLYGENGYKNKLKLAYEYQLTLVFKVQYESGEVDAKPIKSFLSFTAKDDKRISSDYNDTGNPCPPPAGGCKTLGSKLPV